MVDAVRSDETMPTLSLDQMREIDALCARFEAAWNREGVTTSPHFEPFVAEAAEELRLPLRNELIRIDEHYRGLAATAEDTKRDHGQTTSLAPGASDGTVSMTPSRAAEPGTVPDPVRVDGETVSMSDPPGTDTSPTPAPSRRRGTYPVVPGYEIIGELGRGGMGVVYKAIQKGLDRPVALKMILAGAQARDDELERFAAEARAVAKISHENIVKIHEVGEQDGLPYFSLEYVDGGTLASRMGGQPLPPKEAAKLTATLAHAIAAAHEKRIIHRDLKPANILLTLDGQPKITDFGLAKRLEDNSGQTHTGAVMGTPSYMAPEQAWGRTKEIGPGADIYALGAILYDELTGRPPFKGVTTLETLDLVRHTEPVPPRQLQPKIPRDLETICLKCLQKDWRRRYSTAIELAEDLENYLEGKPIKARPVSTAERLLRWSRRNPVVATLAAVVFTLLITIATVSTILSARTNTALIGETKAREKSEQNARAAVEQQGLALDAIRGLLLTVQDELRKRPELLPIRTRIIQIASHDLDKVKDSFLKNPLTARTEAASAVLMGGIYLELGRVNDAVAILDRAFEVVDQEARNRSEDPVAKRNLAAVQNLRGDIKLRLGDSAGARAFYLSALKAREEWIGLVPDRYEPRQSLAESHSLLGRLSFLQGDPKTALDEYETARQIYKSLPEVVLRGIKIRRDLATLDERRGQVRLKLGEVGVAEDLLRGALRVRTQIMQEVGKDPSQVLMVRDVALSQLNIGDLYQFSSRDPVKAWNAYEKALRNFGNLHAMNPEGFDARRDMAMILYRAGDTVRTLKKQGKTVPPAITPKPAETYFAQCLSLREQLAKIDPADTQTKIELMLALARNGRGTDAEPLAEELLKINTVGNDVRFQAACGLALASESEGAGLSARNRDRAFDVLGDLIKNGWKDQFALETDPDLEPLRDDPRFKTIVATLSAKSPE